MHTFTVTHEQFLQSVRRIALDYARSWTPARRDESPLTSEELARAVQAKMVYGRGQRGLRGITQFGGWQNGSTDEFIEVCAMGEESWVQLAGTTIHELAHAANGHGHGHGKSWKAACRSLGLRQVHAAGTFYQLANFAPTVREALWNLPKPTDGAPAMNPAAMLAFKQRPCSAGIGVRGGKSRGAGSGSRLRKYVCAECGQIIRASADGLSLTHNDDGGQFVQDAGKGSGAGVDPAQALMTLLAGAA